MLFQFWKQLLIDFSLNRYRNSPIGLSPTLECRGSILRTQIRCLGLQLISVSQVDILSQTITVRAQHRIRWIDNRSAIARSSTYLGLSLYLLDRPEPSATESGLTTVPVVYVDHDETARVWAPQRIWIITRSPLLNPNLDGYKKV
jgi:hypothetical protein